MNRLKKIGKPKAKSKSLVQYAEGNYSINPELAIMQIMGFDVHNRDMTPIKVDVEEPSRD